MAGNAGPGGPWGGLSTRLYAEPPGESQTQHALSNDCSARQTVTPAPPEPARWPPASTALENLPRASYWPPSDEQGTLS